MTDAAVRAFASVDAWERHGVRVVPGLLPRDLCAELGEVLEAWEADPTAGHAPATEYGRLRHDVWRHVPVLEPHLREGALPDLALDVTGQADLVLYQDVVVCKTPGTPRPIHWHQDFALWPLDRPSGLVMWVALDDADRENGCLSIVPGSATWGERQIEEFGRDPVNPDWPPRLDLDGDEAEVVSIPVSAGDAVLMHPLLWHMSPPNHTDRRRLAWIATWVTPDVRWDFERAEHPYRHTLAPENGSRIGDDVRFPRIHAPGTKTR